MKVLIMENNLILLSRIKSSLVGHEIRLGKDYQGEDVVFINLEQFPPEFIRSFKEAGAKVVAYCGHKNSELIQRAQELGADLVVPNSRVIQGGSLLNLL
ncbi:MAG: hypothetical protein N3D14_04250 [Aquificaceae bacterium]|nr:hypothetical protein [Aquificaceae bacterium]MCX8164586.1 hypothetical protein [Aquificaceae bacterium]